MFAHSGATGPDPTDRNGGFAMPNELTGRRIAFIATDGVEQIELTDPWEAARKAGATPELIAF
jgi:hypothetical protein